MRDGAKLSMVHRPPSSPSTLQLVSNSGRDERLPNCHFAEDAPPVTISALACEIDWQLSNGYALNLPKMEQRGCQGTPFIKAMGLRYFTWQNCRRWTCPLTTARFPRPFHGNN